MENVEKLNTEKLITISVDEYFDLKTRAEMNALLFDRLGQYEGRICALENKLYDLEYKVNGRQMI